MNRKDDFLRLYTENIKRVGSGKLLDWLEDSDFFTAPASTRFHGNYEGGLCEHSVNVWEELVRLLKAYPEVRVTAETATIVTLLHDLCKPMMVLMSSPMLHSSSMMKMPSSMA